MPTDLPRVQVTVDPELQRAIDSVDPAPKSRSRLIRDLALAGTRAMKAEKDSEAEAIGYLLDLADGKHGYDFEAVGRLVESRGEGLP